MPIPLAMSEVEPKNIRPGMSQVAQHGCALGRRPDGGDDLGFDRGGKGFEADGHRVYLRENRLC